MLGELLRRGANRPIGPTLGSYRSLAESRCVSMGRGQPGQVYRHEWQPHDLALWDNRSMLHTVGPACWIEGRRVVHRISMIVHRATIGSR